MISPNRTLHTSSQLFKQNVINDVRTLWRTNLRVLISRLNLIHIKMVYRVDVGPRDSGSPACVTSPCVDAALRGRYHRVSCPLPSPPAHKRDVIDDFERDTSP